MPVIDPNLWHKVIDLQAAGYTQRQISEQTGLRVRTIRRWLARHNAKVIASAEKRLWNIKARMIEQLQHAQSEAMRAWERSKLDAETLEETTDARGGSSKHTLKGQTGNPAYLAEARAAMADLRKILRMEDQPATPVKSVTVEYHRIPDADERFVGTGGHPAVAGVEDGHAPA